MGTMKIKAAPAGATKGGSLTVKPPLRLQTSMDAGTAPRPGSGPVAVIVYHGMGQQVPFETLSGIATVINRAHGERGSAAPTDAVCGYVQFADQLTPRAAFLLKDNQRTREVHVYESYWAPLTEGRITLAETAAFLWSSGLSGMAASWNRNSFRRWLFRGLQDVKFSKDRAPRLWLGAGIALLLIATLLLFALPAWLIGVALLPCFIFAVVNTTTRYLLYTAAVLGALTILNSVIVAVGATSLLRGGGSAWPSPDVIRTLTVDLITGLSLMVVLALLGIAWPVSQRKRILAGPGLAAGSMPRTFWRVSTAGAFLALIATGIAISAHLAGNPPADLIPALHITAVRTGLNRWLGGATAGQWWVLPGIWVLLVALSARMRLWILEFLGDVAIYVSSHRNNRFAETREKIKAAASRLTCAVYGARQPDTSDFLYSDVLIVGHSLGSVIAYDALNAAINQDLLAGGTVGVSGRTPLFLTFGSPLDKTAFLFRSQLDHAAPLREALASAAQPLILSDDLRPGRWVNIYSPDDWVSGDLSFYDDPNWAIEHPSRVQNLPDPHAVTPGACHNEYWTNPLLGTILYEAIVA